MTKLLQTIPVLLLQGWMIWDTSLIWRAQAWWGRAGFNAKLARGRDCANVGELPTYLRAGQSLSHMARTWMQQLTCKAGLIPTWTHLQLAVMPRLSDIKTGTSHA